MNKNNANAIFLMFLLILFQHMGAKEAPDMSEQKHLKTSVVNEIPAKEIETIVVQSRDDLRIDETIGTYNKVTNVINAWWYILCDSLDKECGENADLVRTVQERNAKVPYTVSHEFQHAINQEYFPALPNGMSIRDMLLLDEIPVSLTMGVDRELFWKLSFMNEVTARISELVLFRQNIVKDGKDIFVPDLAPFNRMRERGTEGMTDLARALHNPRDNLFPSIVDYDPDAFAQTKLPNPFEYEKFQDKFFLKFQSMSDYYKLNNPANQGVSQDEATILTYLGFKNLYYLYTDPSNRRLFSQENMYGNLDSFIRINLLEGMELPDGFFEFLMSDDWPCTVGYIDRALLLNAGPKRTADSNPVFQQAMRGMLTFKVNGEYADLWAKMDPAARQSLLDKLDAAFRTRYESRISQVLWDVYRDTKTIIEDCDQFPGSRVIAGNRTNKDRAVAARELIARINESRRAAFLPQITK